MGSVRPPDALASIRSGPVAAGIAFFDLDNTLIDRDAAFRRWTMAFVEQRNLGNAAVEWIVAHDLNGNAQRSDLFAQIRDRYAFPDITASLVRDYEREYPTFITEDADVHHSLRRLRAAGWRIAIVTNGHALQRVKVRNAGLDRLVDACCVSAELGYWKPDRRIFEQAMVTCGGRDVDGSAWMVGDSAEHDMTGARALGMETIWMHRGRSWTEQEFQPGHAASSVSEAVDIMLAASSVCTDA